MAATKRKRRGGLAVQAKKPKRNEKDAAPPAKRHTNAEEVEEEERDRIPGPVCKVEGDASGGGGSVRLFLGYLLDYSSANFRIARVLTVGRF